MYYLEIGLISSRELLNHVRIFFREFSFFIKTTADMISHFPEIKRSFDITPQGRKMSTKGLMVTDNCVVTVYMLDAYWAHSDSDYLFELQRRDSAWGTRPPK